MNPFRKCQNYKIFQPFIGARGSEFFTTKKPERTLTHVLITMVFMWLHIIFKSHSVQYKVHVCKLYHGVETEKNKVK